MKLLFIFSTLFVIYLGRIHSACVLECPDTCYINNVINTSECELLIDRAKFVAGGLDQSAVSTDLTLNLSGTVTEIKFAFIQGQSDPLTVNLISQESMAIRVISIDGPMTLTNQFFRQYPNLESVKLGRTIGTDFPTFRFNHDLATLEFSGVSPDSNGITAAFVSYLDALVSIIFDCESVIEFSAPGVFDGLTALTKLELNRVDLSGANPLTFAPLSAVKEVSIQNAQLSNLDSMPTRAQIESLNLASNNLDETGLHFSGFDSLTWLGLSENSFTRLNRTLLEGMPLLEHLDLSGNQIREISNDTFEDTELRSVNLVDSQLTRLNYEVLAPLVDLTLFALDGNPLECDCGLQWVSLFHSIFEVDFNVDSNAVCGTPADSSGRDIVSAENFESCNPNVTCYCSGEGSDLNCSGTYYCGLIPRPIILATTIPSNATNATVPVNATIHANATNATNTPSEDTLAPPTLPPFQAGGVPVEVVLGITGVIFVIIFAVVVFFSFCFCYYCCCKGDKYSYHI